MARLFSHISPKLLRVGCNQLEHSELHKQYTDLVFGCDPKRPDPPGP